MARYRRRFQGNNENHVRNGFSDQDFLLSIGAARLDCEGVARPTRAGLLMFGQERWITDEFPHYFLDYRQETDSDTRWEDRFTSYSGDWSGNIYDFYYRAYDKLKQALKTPFKLKGVERDDDTPAHEALREAIVNCLTNANYYERRGIVCKWKNDALEIENPGDFRIPIEEAMKPGESDPRNETMLKMFSLVNAGERAGSGITKIIHGWQETKYKQPFYNEQYGPDRIILTMPLAGAEDARTTTNFLRHSENEGSVDLNLFASLADREKKAVVIAAKAGRVTSRDLAEAVGVSQQTASNTLKGMVKNGILVWVGNSTRDAYQYYKLPQGLEAFGSPEDRSAVSRFLCMH